MELEHGWHVRSSRRTSSNCQWRRVIWDAEEEDVVGRVLYRTLGLVERNVGCAACDLALRREGSDREHKWVDFVPHDAIGLSRFL